MRQTKSWRNVVIMAAIGGLALTSITACSSEKDAEGNPIDSAIPKVTGTTFGKKPEKIAAGVKGKEPKALAKATLIKGNGKKCSATDTVYADYQGQLWNGTKFDSSWDNSGKPVTFQMNKLIKGWQQGLNGAKEGSRTVMVIPSNLGYGKEGMPPTIPANSTLVFVVDVHKCLGTPKVNQEYTSKLTPVNPLPEVPGLTITGEGGKKPDVKVDWGAFKASGKQSNDPVLYASGNGPEIKADDFIAVTVTQIDESNNQVRSQWDDKSEVQWIQASQAPKFVGLKAGSRLVVYIQPQKADQAKNIPVDQPAMIGVLDIVAHEPTKTK